MSFGGFSGLPRSEGPTRTSQGSCCGPGLFQFNCSAAESVGDRIPVQLVQVDESLQAKALKFRYTLPIVSIVIPFFG